MIKRFEKEYQKLTIKDLCDILNLPRSTFYQIDNTIVERLAKIKENNINDDIVWERIKQAWSDKFPGVGYRKLHEYIKISHWKYEEF